MTVYYGRECEVLLLLTHSFCVDVRTVRRDVLNLHVAVRQCLACDVTWLLLWQCDGIATSTRALDWEVVGLSRVLGTSSCHSEISSCWCRIHGLNECSAVTFCKTLNL